MPATTKNAPARSGNSGEGCDNPTHPQKTEGAVMESIFSDTSTQATGWQWFDPIEQDFVSPVLDTVGEAADWIECLPPYPIDRGFVLREVAAKPPPPVVEWWATHARVHGLRGAEEPWTAEAERIVFRADDLPAVRIHAAYRLTDDGWIVTDPPGVHIEQVQENIWLSDPEQVASFGAALGTAALVLASIQGGAK